MGKIKSSVLKINLTSASFEDVKGIQEVFYKTWLLTYPNKELGITLDDIEERFKDSFSDEALAKRWKRVQGAQNEKLIIAKEGGKVVGLIRVLFNPDNNQLQAIYILPEYQGKGIGTLLWKEASKYFDPKKTTIVQVAIYNANAIGFYKKLGFKDNGKRWSDEKLRMKSGSIIPQMEMEIKASQA
jgi:GNAT superfamily N-acetyltransferase